MGNFRFIKGAEWWDTACHRSLLSWQSLYAMKKAVMNLGQVVRFASFACSGAEVYDGFFRAQLSPPVTEAQGNRIVMRQERDGGDIMDRPARKNDARQPVVTEERRDKAVLNKSQLNAAIALLCEGTSKPGASESFRPQQSVLRSTYYGKFNYDQCDGRMRQPRCWYRLAEMTGIFPRRYLRDYSKNTSKTKLQAIVRESVKADQAILSSRPRQSWKNG